MKRDFDLLFRVVGLGEKRNEKTETLKHNPHLLVCTRKCKNENEKMQKNDHFTIIIIKTRSLTPLIQEKNRIEEVQRGERNKGYQNHSSRIFSNFY